MVDFIKFKEKGRALYRELMKEDLEAMKIILEGAKYVPLTEDLRIRYEILAANVRSWKRLIKINQ